MRTGQGPPAYQGAQVVGVRGVGGVPRGARDEVLDLVLVQGGASPRGVAALVRAARGFTELGKAVASIAIKES